MFEIRPGTDADSAPLIALIGDVFGEYAGCVLDVDGEMPELRAPATDMAEAGGLFWVAEVAGELVGTVSCRPTGVSGVLELKRLYVRANQRRQGLARHLAALVEDAACDAGCPMIELWSDSRFTAAHAFYARQGFRRGPERRFLHDLSATWEFYFWKQVGGWKGGNGEKRVDGRPSSP